MIIQKIPREEIESNNKPFIYFCNSKLKAEKEEHLKPLVIDLETLAKSYRRGDSILDFGFPLGVRETLVDEKISDISYHRSSSFSKALLPELQDKLGNVSKKARTANLISNKGLNLDFSMHISSFIEDSIRFYKRNIKTSHKISAKTVQSLSDMVKDNYTKHDYNLFQPNLADILEEKKDKEYFLIESLEEDEVIAYALDNESPHHHIKIKLIPTVYKVLETGIFTKCYMSIDQRDENDGYDDFWHPPRPFGSKIIGFSDLPIGQSEYMKMKSPEGYFVEDKNITLFYEVNHLYNAKKRMRD